MRNLVAHHCDKANDDLVWAALTRRLPKLVDALGLRAAKPPSIDTRAAPEPGCPGELGGAAAQGEHAQDG
jgi:hypothetical protein